MDKSLKPNPSIVVMLLILIVIVLCNLYLETLSTVELNEILGEEPSESSSKIMVIGGKIVAQTTLTPEQMDIQRDKGCPACHPK